MVDLFTLIFDSGAACDYVHELYVDDPLDAMATSFDLNTVRPRDVTADALTSAWYLRDDEEDVTAMLLTAEGVRSGRPTRWRASLVDRYDGAGKVTSMARTTGYTCTAAVRLLARGLWTEPGIAPPELLGREAACHDFILADLERHNVFFRQAEESITNGR